MATEIKAPFDQYTNSVGAPLNAGKIYIGVAGMNPETNPISLYWDSAFTSPASNPLTTSGGLIYRNGTPAKIFCQSANYSITVKDSKGLLVYSNLNTVDKSVTFDSVSDLATINPIVIGSNTVIIGDADRGGVFTWVASGTVDNGIVFAGLTGYWKRSVSSVVNAKWFGAKGDGTTDDTVAIQNAINSNYEVFLPAGKYKITSSLTISAKQKLSGEDKTSSVIWVYFGAGSTSVASSAVKVDGSGEVHNVSFWYPTQNNAGSPVQFPPSIYLTNYYGVVKNVNLLNSYIGILADASAFTITDVAGYPLAQGIYIYQCFDVPKVTNIHFNPNVLWNFSSLDGYANPDATTITWVKNNGTAYIVGRCDFSNFSHWFAWGYNIGINLKTAVVGSAEACYFEQCHIDITRYPLKIDNFQNSAVFSKCKFVSNGTEGTYNHIAGGTPGAKITFLGCFFNNYFTYAFDISTSSPNVSFVGCLFTNWNLVNSGYAMINASALMGLSLIGCTINFGAITNATARAIFCTSTSSYQVTFVDNKVIKTSTAELIRILGGKLVMGNNDLTESPYNLCYTPLGNGYPTTVSYACSIPTVGSWTQGDIVYNVTATAGGFIGWVCVATGSPGTWKTFGAISA